MNIAGINIYKLFFFLNIYKFSIFFCRYRKSIKALEEGIVEKTLSPYFQTPLREVPVNTNSEQVLFCRRVYEFRLKRLIKNPS